MQLRVSLPKGPSANCKYGRETLVLDTSRNPWRDGGRKAARRVRDRKILSWRPGFCCPRLFLGKRWHRNCFDPTYGGNGD